MMATIATTFKKGAASTIVTIKSADTKMNKGRGTNLNPYLGRVTIVKTFNGYVMGTDYKSSLERIANRMGNQSQVELKKVWHKPCEYLGEWFSTDRATESKFYLKLQRNEQQKGFNTHEDFYLDGRKASEEEIEEIEKWIPKRKGTQSSTQVENGIDKAHEQHFILVQLESITLIKQGELELHPTSSYAMVGA